MAEIKNPAHVLVEITPDELLGEVMKFKNQKLRLSQICCAYSNEKIELSYSFADDETNLDYYKCCPWRHHRRGGVGKGTGQDG